MKKLIAILILSAALCGCAAAMPYIRGLWNIATLFCQNTHAERLGANAAEVFCREKKNVQPFYDELIPAKQAVARKLGIAK